MCRGEWCGKERREEKRVVERDGRRVVKSRRNEGGRRMIER